MKAEQSLQEVPLPNPEPIILQYIEEDHPDFPDIRQDILLILLALDDSYDSSKPTEEQRKEKVKQYFAAKSEKEAYLEFVSYHENMDAETYEVWNCPIEY